MMEKKLSISVTIVSAAIVSLPLVRFCLSGEIPAGDDVKFHLGRIQSIAIEIPYHFPVYMFSDWLRGLGVPATIFYPSLFFYFPATLLSLGLDESLVYDGFLIFIVMLGGIFSYIGFKRILGSSFLGGVAASIYIAQGYFLHDLYQRASIGEVLAMIFLPLALSISRQRIFEAVLIFSAILESHILTATMILPICLILTRFDLRFILWTLGLNAFFIIPFIDQYLAVDVMIKTIHADSLVEVAWNFSRDEFLRSIGFVGILNLLGIFFCRERKFWIFFLLSILFALMSTDFFPWQSVEEILPLVTTIQFPWRFMMFYALCSSISAAILLHQIFRKPEFVFGFCIVNAFISANPQIKPLEFPFESLYIDYAPREIGFEQFYRWRDGIDPMRDPRITRFEHFRGKTFVEFHDPHGSITLPIIFYDGYEVRDESGKLLPIKPSPQHLIEVEVRSGSRILVEYRGLIIFDVATTISLVTLILFIWRWQQCRRE